MYQGDLGSMEAQRRVLLECKHELLLLKASRPNCYARGFNERLLCNRIVVCPMYVYVYIRVYTYMYMYLGFFLTEGGIRF